MSTLIKGGRDRTGLYDDAPIPWISAEKLPVPVTNPGNVANKLCELFLQVGLAHSKKPSLYRKSPMTK